MINLKKTLIAALLAATAVSPIIPSVNAGDGQWNSVIAEAAWDYDLYRVERLSTGKNVSGPFEFNDGIFLSEQAKSCKYPDACQLVDLTFVKNGSLMRVNDVNPRVLSPFWHSGQDGRFVYLVPSSSKDSWGTVFGYLPESGVIQTLSSIVRKTDDINYLTSSVDGTRVYASILHKDAQTGAVETKLSVADYAERFERDDFTWTLNARWQEILDVRDRLVLAKFHFDGGHSQLILIDEAHRTVKDIPGTWTTPDGDIVAAHFLSDGTVQYFQNFRMYTYKPGDEKATESGGAYLNWFADPKDSIQIVGDRMAYLDPENTLYVTSPQGASSFGKVLNGKFTLEADAVYFQSPKEFNSYTFSTKTWKARHFQVTDAYEDILIGTDAQGNIWYENETSGKTVNIGYGSAPVLTDREHAIWKGADGHIYQVTFSSLLDLGKSQVQAFKAYGESTVYLQVDQKTWRVPDEQTYFTWFSSWAKVTSVSTQTAKVYLDKAPLMGDAPFAPGTRVKAAGNARVYVSGTNGSLHWMVSETVANQIYGSSWNKGIIEVRPERLWNYPTGSRLNSSTDIQQI
ncbi:hypothetical protein HZA85_02305 [Candidatus Uhrbacteria bacterium]|nr:hypothetical protein [Candidatus Uhrbacteria bacterium]